MSLQHIGFVEVYMVIVKPELFLWFSPKCCYDWLTDAVNYSEYEYFESTVGFFVCVISALFLSVDITIVS